MKWYIRFRERSEHGGICASSSIIDVHPLVWLDERVREYEACCDPVKDEQRGCRYDLTFFARVDEVPDGLQALLEETDATTIWEH